MTGSWLIVKWAVASAAGLCVGVLLIVWIIEGSNFVCEKPGQKFFLAFGIASFLSGVLTSRLCFVVAGIIYAWIAIELLRHLANRGKVWLRG